MRKKYGVKPAHQEISYTQEMILELVKCSSDPIYFIEKYCVIKHPLHGKIPFKLYDFQKKMIETYHTKKRSITTASRQIGKTSTTSAFLLWYAIFNPEKTVLIASNKSKGAMEIMASIKFAYEELPYWIKPGVSEDTYNKHEIMFDNHSRIVATTTSADSGRGMAISKLYCDELRFVSPHKAREFWDSILPTISCVTGDTLVLTDNGLIRIDELIKQYGDISNVGLHPLKSDINVWGNNGIEYADQYFNSRESEIYRITTRTGMYVKTNNIHPLLTIDKDGNYGDVQAQNLKVGDHLRVEIGTNVFGKNEIPVDDAYMLGGYIAEGWMNKQKRKTGKVPVGIYISNTSPEFREIFLRNGFTIVQSNKNRLLNSNKIMIDKFIRYGVDPFRLCDSKTVPSVIMGGSREVVANFLRGLFDGDGCASTRGICLTSTSYELIYQVKLLLNNFGIPSSINRRDAEKIMRNRVKKNRILPQGRTLKSARDVYNLSIKLSDSKKFLDEIGFRIQYKAERAKQLVRLRKQDNIKKKQIPFSVINPILMYLLQHITGQEFRDNGLRVDRVKAGKQKYVNTHWITKLYDISQKLGIDIPSNHLELITELINEQCYWDEIIKIEILPSEVTYDLRVPGTHHFYQNGIMGHNTGGSIIVSSTPNGDSNLFAELWRGANAGTNEFKDGVTFVPWNVPPGRDEAFKKKYIGLLGKRKWEQEYECKFLSEELTLVDSALITQAELLLEQKIQANTLIKFTVNNDRFEFYEHLVRDAVYIVGVDPSTGSGSDGGVITVYEFPAMKQVLEYTTTTLSPQVMYTELKSILKFLEQATSEIYFSVENNGVGQGILTAYEGDIEPPLAALISHNNTIGVNSNVKTKIRGCLQFRELFERGKITINSRDMLTELKSFVRHAGSYAAQTGSTDDRVMATIIVFYIIQEMAQSNGNAYDMIYTVASEIEKAHGFSHDLSESNNEHIESGGRSEMLQSLFDSLHNQSNDGGFVIT